MHKRITLKKNIKIYIKMAQTLSRNVLFELAKVTVVASSNNTLPDDGDYTETCWSCFNVNFNILFKAVLLCISW